MTVFLRTVTCVLALLIVFGLAGGTGASARDCVSNGKVYKICVSSTLAPQGQQTYAARNLLSPGQAWCEGARGKGLNETITLHFSGHSLLHGIEIENGYNRTAKTYRLNGRVKAVSLTSDKGVLGVYDLRDQAEAQTIPLMPARYRWIRMRVVEVYAGAKYQDLCVNTVWPDLR